jgi:nicotinate-nucleotide adenylyltransferase
MRVGLLGGSFNPAHEGHRHIARLALRRLRLDQVWLLVSPGNPLKPVVGMAPLPERLASARAMGDGRRLVATAIEAALGTRYTADTLTELHRRFPHTHFVWLMGADNLEQLPRWNRWAGIARIAVFAVFPRPSYNHRALAGQAARCLRSARRASHLAPALAGMAPPAWVFLPVSQHAASATAIRAASDAAQAQRLARPPGHGVSDHRPQAAARSSVAA